MDLRTHTRPPFLPPSTACKPRLPAHLPRPHPAALTPHPHPPPPSPPRRYPDPSAQAFVTRFLQLSRDANLAYLATADPGLQAGLAGIGEAQWQLLQGYLVSLMGTWGNATFNAFVAAGGEAVVASMVQAEASKWQALAALSPEKAMVYTLLPLAVRSLLDAVTYQAMLPGVEAQVRASPLLAGWPADAPLPAAAEAEAVSLAEAAALQQWANCSIMVSALRRSEDEDRLP